MATFKLFFQSGQAKDLSALLYCKKRGNQYSRKSCGNKSLVQLLGLNVMGSDHKW